MSTVRTDNKTRSSAASSRWRWLVVGLLSLVLHLTALNWATGNFHLPGESSEASPVVMQTTLIQPPPAVEPAPRPIPVAAHVTRPRPKPAARPQTAAATPTPANPPPAATETPPVLAAASSDTAMASIAPASTQSGSATAGPNIPDLASLEPEAAASPAATAEKTAYKIDPPPSATLGYAVQSLREGQMVYGHGKIAWKRNGTQYTINGEAGILFFTLIDFGSQGRIDESGIVPTQYTEKRFRRAQTETRFNRDSKVISFSASPKSFPLQGGEQDRASIIWQLASIGRGDAGQFTPGAQIPLFIAGVRDGETWNIKVIGEEDVTVGMGSLRAWHVRRAPRAGEKDQILDIWLAPSQNWYPVKLRYTEVNGEYLELSLSNIEAPAS